METDVAAELREVTYAYKGSEKPAVAIDFLRVDQGEIVGLIGPSGCGKSTLLFVLGLMLRPTSGSVRVLGQDLSAASDAERSRFRASRLGFVFQDYLLDTSRSVRDNVLEVSKYRGDSTARRQAHVRVDHLLSVLGVDLDRTRRASDLSGGQSQRVAVCRALFPMPSLILADEPTGNLDRASAKDVMNELERQAKRGVAVIVVTHSPDALPRNTRVIEIGG